MSIGLQQDVYTVLRHQPADHQYIAALLQAIAGQVVGAGWRRQHSAVWANVSRNLLRMVGSLTRRTPQYSGAGHVTTCGLQYTVTSWPRGTRRVARFSTHVSTPLYRAGMPREPSSAIFTRSSTST